ncbi:MFS transporter [Rhodococcus sp. NPDC056743]|uniref:MFS transporter n=1 Tax=Rhodococcus sp. NPDC056743 TaxID=3345934 RepID=UPI00366E8488
MTTQASGGRANPPSGPHTVRDPGMQKRAAASGAVGQSLEYFDFTVYGALSATLFPQLFFSDLGESGALLASFATFGVGFVARPLGAITFGYLGDRIGRRPVLFITLMIMALSSIAIGLLPTGKGFAIAAILVGLRFLQGFSLGGEATGNQLMVMEHSDPHRRGLMGSFVNVGATVSQVVANLALLLLTTTLSEQQWQSWGWRVPFLASIALVAVAVYMRLKLTETPAFQAVDDSVTESVEPKRNSGLRVVMTHPGYILRLALAWGGILITFYLVLVYGLSVMKSEAGFSSSTTFLVLVVASAAAIPACIAGGWVSDKIGRQKTVIIALAGCAIGLTLFFLLMSTKNVLVIGAAATFAICSNQFANGAQAALFAEQFPTEVRFSGSALSITFSNLIFSAPAPFVATALTAAAGDIALVAVALTIMVISLIAMLSIKDRTGIDLVTYNEEPGHNEKSMSTADDPQWRASV